MRRPSLQRTAPHLLLVGGLAVWTAIFVQHARRLWFFGDDFDFLLNRSLTLTGDHGLLMPHNEHWSTIPIILFRLNYAVFGLHHYLPYALLPIVFHVLICVLSFILLRLSHVGRWAAALATVVVAFSAGGAGAENTLWDFQVGFLGSCLFGLIALVVLAADRWGGVGTAFAVVALVLSLMSSGMGIVMVVWAVVFVFTRDGLRAALMTGVVPAAVYLAWYAAYGRGHTGAPPADVSVAPLAAMRGLGSLWSTASGIPGAGPVLLLAMVAAVVVPRHNVRLFALAGSGLVAVVTAYALLGYSRSGIGIDATMRSRYVYFGVVLTVPALAAGLQVLGRRLASRPDRTALIAWLAVAAVVVAVGTVQADRWTASRKSLIGDNRARIVAAARLVESGAVLLRTQPMPTRNPDVAVAALTKPSVRAALPDVEPGRKAELDVAVHLQVDVTSVPHAFAPPSVVRWRGFGQPDNRSTPTPCTTRTASVGSSIEFPVSEAGTEVGITVNGSEVGTQLVSAGQRSPVVRWPTQPGQQVYVASTAGDATLRVKVPSGAVTVCTG